MTQSRATRARAERKLAVALHEIDDRAKTGLVRRMPQQERRQLAEKLVLVAAAPPARGRYAYRAMRASRHHQRGQQRRLERYLALDSAGRLSAYRITISLALAGDIHAGRRQAHIVEAGCRAGDAWALQVRAQQQGAPR